MKIIKKCSKKDLEMLRKEGCGNCVYIEQNNCINLDDYKYVVLIDSKGEMQLWNDGRYEENIDSLYVDVQPNEIPVVRISKI